MGDDLGCDLVGVARDALWVERCDAVEARYRWRGILGVGVCMVVAISSGWRGRDAFGLVGVDLRARGPRLDDEALGVKEHLHLLSGLEAKVAALLLVVALRVGERVLFPGEGSDAVFDRVDQHGAVAQARQVQVSGEVGP